MPAFLVGFVIPAVSVGCACGLVAFFIITYRVARWLRAFDARRTERDIARIREMRRLYKPGPSKRAEERKLMRARMTQLQADIAAGRVTPMGPRYQREPKA